MKILQKWYTNKQSIIIHSIISLLSLLIAFFGLALGIGVGIGGGKGGSPLIGVFIYGGFSAALYCIFMSIFGLVRRNRRLDLASNDETGLKIFVIIVAVIVILPITNFLAILFGPQPNEEYYESLYEQSETQFEEDQMIEAEGTEDVIDFDALNRAELIKIANENNIEYCEKAHKPLKDDIGFEDCQIMVHINDSIDISFSRNLIMWAYQEIHSP